MQLPVIPSPAIQAGFVVLAMLLGVWWVFAVSRAFAGPAASGLKNSKVVIAFGVCIIWVGLLFMVSQQSWIHSFDSFPPPGLRVFFALLLVTTIIAFSPIGRRMAESVPLIWLIGFQVFRLPTELLIHQAATAGLAPMEMTFQGRNFDIVTAILALVLFLFMRRAEVSKKWIFYWNILGMLLLINVVATAIMSMPHPLQVLDTNPPNVWVTYFPFILLPGVAVCSALLGHLLVFRALAVSK